MKAHKYWLYRNCLGLFRYFTSWLVAFQAPTLYFRKITKQTQAIPVESKYYRWLLLITMLVIIFSFYLEYKGWLPCPLCVMQRICAFDIALCSIGLMCIQRKFMLRCLLVVSIFLALSGIFFATHQLWLQHHVAIAANEMCMPGFNMLVRYFSWSVILHTMFWGTSSCSNETLHLLGISMPVWSIIYFIWVLIVLTMANARRFKL